MINSKEDYKRYLREDLKAHGNGNLQWRWHKRLTWHMIYYQRVLRKAEYYHNCKKSFIGRLMFKWVHLHFLRLSVKFGFSIPINAIGEGLRIAHRGTIVINDNVKIGRNFVVHVCVNIGEGNRKTPVIGDNVYVGPGAKIFGGITIGDNVQIGANAVVNKDIEPNVVVAGVPAKVVKRLEEVAI